MVMDSLLIVDDSIDLLNLYRAMIARMGGYRIAGMASDGNEAISAYRGLDRKPDLVLMDVNMPNLDGISAAMAIQRMDSAANILFVTAENIYHKDLPAELSESAILKKPFSRDELFRALKTRIKRK